MCCSLRLNTTTDAIALPPVYNKSECPEAQQGRLGGEAARVLFIDSRLLNSSSIHIGVVFLTVLAMSL